MRVCMHARALNGLKRQFLARAVSPNDVATGAETVGAEMRVRSIRAVRAPVL